MRVRRSRARPPCYHSWIAMRRYCGHVGGATPYQLSHYVSVSVCREWLDYGAFEEWAMSNGWFRGAHLTRRDKNGDFCPDNCFWCSLAEANGYRSCVRRLSDGRSARDLLGPRNLGRDRTEQARVAGRLFGWHGRYRSRWDNVEDAISVVKCTSRFMADYVRVELARDRAERISELQQKGSA